MSEQPKAMRVLQQILERPRRRPEEACEMCGAPVPAEHGHVVDLETRALRCTCRACTLLFTNPGAGGGRYRAIPERSLWAPRFSVSPQDWSAIGIPVSTAFFFRNSSLDRTVAFYPSPGGATESLLDLTLWDQVLAANPAVPTPEDDVEALLIRYGADDVECFLVPIDVCYELVGIVRQRWKGFDGGAEAHEAIDAFFARLRERSAVIEDPA